MQKSAGIALRTPYGRRLRPRACPYRPRCRTKNRTICFGGRFPERRRRSHERLLRYPNGDTRLIRYPATESETEPDLEQTDTVPNAQAANPVKTSELPSSPAELMRLVRSKAYVKGQKEHRRRIRDSYQEIKKLYVLAVRDLSREELQMYTLRTRLHREDVTKRLKTMFRGPNFKGEFIQVDSMADGVLTFSDLDNAERFKALVEAEESKQVEICETTSTKLFQSTHHARAVVILINSTDYVPSLHELTTSLKAQTSLESDA